MPTAPAEQTNRSAPQRPPLLIGVDVGGTFTDLVAYDPADGSLRVVKLPSTPPDFHRAVIEAVHRVAPPGTPAAIVHGSTVATNALLQRAGQPVAFVTTDGFRDMLLIGRQNRPNLYALEVVRPQPLTAEENWFTVRERIGANGEVVQPLDPAEVDRLIERIRASGLRHVAVCLLFSFINPTHEQLIGRRCREAGLTVSLSSEVLPEFREYERASTTVINGSLRPTVEEYLNALVVQAFQPASSTPFGQEPAAAAQEVGTAKSLSMSGSDESGLLKDPSMQAGKPAPQWSIMHSAGGTLSPEEAGRSAARLVLSGPAGGVMGALFAAEAAGLRDVITYDMGGTSTDVAVIVDGRPQWTTASTVDGLPIGLPAFDIVTVGAGGGSVAYLDAGGALRVGPRSAGAVPGPACYARGGTEPTVTDANLLLGRILPDRFAGGTMRVDPDLARRAIEPLAARMGKTVEEAALGIVRVAEHNMSRAVRAVTSQRGLDPRRFTLVSFGGAGGLHACALAESLDIPRVLVPPYCGVLSALGMVAAPAVADASKTVVHLAGQLDDARLAAEFGYLNLQVSRQPDNEHTASVEAYADVRFRGQSHEVKVRVTRPTWETITAAFHEAYQTLYGQVPKGRAVEIVTLRIRRVGRRPAVALPSLVDSPHGGEGIEEKLTDGAGTRVPARVVRRSNLVEASESGPLLLIDQEATTYVPPAWRAAGRRDGSVELTASELSS
jgi:N-methylhydantoinase A